MRAARTTAKERIDLVELDDPTPGPGRAVVRIEHATLCGTDLHIWEDDYVTELPLIQGHELAGTVLAVGDGVDGLAPGDRVAIDPLESCGACAACRGGRPNVCANLTVLGCYRDGGLAERIEWDAAKLHRVPDGMPTELAAVAEPTSIAMQAVRRGRATAADVALVLGCGPIGLLATLCLADLGATVVAADTVPERLALAASFGAVDTVLVDPAVEFPGVAGAVTLDRLTGGAGPGLVIEATGVPESLTNAVRAVAPAGRVVQVGISGRPAAFPLNLVPFKEVDLLGSRNSLGLIPDCLEVIDRHQQVVGSLLTHRFPLDRLGDAFETMRDRTQLVGKVLIDVQQGVPA